ncbi:WxL protein peptidoglycan domain-containing protein, partial [Pseudactinotalea sp.]|uniref:WxL protein peptidoglycan domain-containing protein n=1 Tax=Pseudactinotalea sp. TaxID=1926260 RepID=UPI003B3A43FA
IQDGLEVANTGEAELTLAVAAADGFTTANGVLDLVPVTDPQLDLGAWVVPEVSELTLAPGDRVEVPFTLTVPQDAAPGDHTGGIVTIRTSDAGGTVQLEQRLASRIHVRVPGEQVVTLAVSDLEIDQPAQLNPVAAGTATVRYAVRNEGSVRTLYTERVTVSGPGGIGTVEAVATVEEILPGSEIVRVVEVPGVWSLGYTDVSVDVVPQAVDGELAAPILLDGGAWSVPWSILALLVLVIAAAIVIGVLRSKREAASAAPEQVP